MAETARRIVLASRPVGEPKPSRFPPGGISRFRSRAPGKLLLQDEVALARPLHARAHERCAVLRQAGRHRRGDGGRHGQRGGCVEQRRVHKLATSCSAASAGRRTCVSDGSGLAQARPDRCADLDRARRARHAGHDGLHGPARNRSAEGGRDGRRVGGLRRGRRGGRADREDQGRARGRHRGRAGEVRLREGRTRLRRLHRSSRVRRLPRSSRPRARRASTSISRTSAVRCGTRCFRCSTTSRAFRCAD